MFSRVNRPSYWFGLAAIIVSCASGMLAIVGPLSLLPIEVDDAFYLGFLCLHIVWGLLCIWRRGRPVIRGGTLLLNELLLTATLFAFLFAYIYAANANLDYVQRFIRAGGQLHLALDTRSERLLVSGRYLPLLLLNGGIYVALRAGRRLSITRWALVLALLSGLLKAFALPSFLSLTGIGILGWICLAPVLLVLRRCSFLQSILYGGVYGIAASLFSYYWLATYSLLSLQFTVVIYSLFYMLFFAILGGLYHLLLRPLSRRSRTWASAARVLFFGLMWCGFEYARSSGFLGFPLGLMAHTQYRFVPFIQMASVTGVWGISLVVVVVNALLAEASEMLLHRRLTLFLRPLIVAAAVVALPTIVGAIALGRESTAADAPGAAERTVRVALIQQNTDPRKHDFVRTFSTLQQLTDQALRWSPDLVVWGETAFVPNIRRWSREDPERFRNARLVRQLLAYQAATETYLLTGNDDYFTRLSVDGETERYDYNAAILFSDSGERLETYHKIKLVPFSEYFPYRAAFPWIDDLLQDFDTVFWTPGSIYTVFEHPKLKFATPICFEDIFPRGVRRFVRAGAELIVNISNDYWSLAETEAKQHAVAAQFRTIENRRPMVRATVSGLTGFIDRYGRLQQSLPYFKEGFLVVDVPLQASARQTFYTLAGDWLPIAALIAITLATLAAGLLLALRLVRSQAPDRRDLLRRRGTAEL